MQENSKRTSYFKHTKPSKNRNGYLIDDMLQNSMLHSLLTATYLGKKYIIYYLELTLGNKIENSWNMIGWFKHALSSKRTDSK